MSDGGPGPQPFERPRWVLPVAVVGALLILMGIVLTAVSGGDDEPDVPIIGTSTTITGG